jgi:hypothetical protein
MASFSDTYISIVSLVYEIMFFMIILTSFMLVMFLVKTVEIPDCSNESDTHGNFYTLKVHENLYDHINDMGTVVLFLASWCDKSQRIKKLLDDRCDCNMIIVDERHPDSVLAQEFPSLYIFNGTVLEKGSIKQVSDFLIS